jgi:pimeloyl-ACP methyl ester carboxylesterase
MYETGNGKPLLLLHGLVQSGQKWEPLIKQLDTRKWRIIAPDLLGFGKSPKPDWKRYSVQEHADAVLYALKRAKVTRPMTIVGHSMGCLVAVHIAAKYPKRVKRLVLYEPPLLADDPAYRRHARRRMRYLAFYAYIASHPELAFLRNQLTWRLIRRLTGLHLSEEEWPPFERSLRNTIMSQTAYAELRDISIPTHIVHGRLDLIVNRVQMKKMFVQNPNIALHVVNDIHDISPRSAKYLAKLLERTRYSA